MAGSILNRASQSLSLLPKFLWICLTNRPDVIHVTVSGMPGYYRDMLYVLIAWILRIKIILNLRSGDTAVLTSKVFMPARPLVYSSLRSAWCVAPLSTQISDTLKDLNIDKIKVMPNCVDIRPAPNTRASSSEDGRILRLLYVGWLIPAKGIEELMDALQMVEGVQLTLVGPFLAQYAGDNANWVIDLIGERELNDRVISTGRLDTEQARNVYRQNDALILPSRLEGFPNVVLEGMEAGIPVIATRVGAIPEIIRDGRDGYIVDVKDVNAMAERIADLRDNPDKRSSMGQSARERIIEHFSAEKVAKMWVDLYRCAASGAKIG